MDSNTHSTSTPDGLTALAAAVEGLAAQDLDGLTDAVRAERVLVLRRLLDRLEGHWLAELAGVDARGAAGADQGVRLPPPPAGAAAGSAGRGRGQQCRADRPGPVPRPPDRDRPGRDRRGAVGGPRRRAGRRHPRPDRSHCCRGRTGAGGGGPAAGPTPAAAAPGASAAGGRPQSERDRTERRHQDRWVRLTPASRAWWPSMGCWSPRPARCCWPLWGPWPARPTPRMTPAVANGPPMPSPSWPAVSWRAGGSPRLVGCGPS